MIEPLTSGLKWRAGAAHLLGRRALAGRVVSIARRRGARVAERDGVTIVTATWNSKLFLEGFLQGVRAFGSDDLEIIVVDNNSHDGTREFLQDQADVTTVHNPVNIGHGLALDLAFAKAQTTKVIAMDVDAFPISSDFMPLVLEPLDQGAMVAGAYVQRAFIHPSYLAMRRRDFFELNLSFAPVGLPTAPGGTPRGLFMDVGEALSQTVAVVAGSKSLHRIPITSSKGDNMIGSLYGDAVYHNFYSTQGKPELVEQAKQVWHEALLEYLPGEDDHR